MFNFGGITHVIENPKGHADGYNYSLVGSVPASMLEEKPATRADVMGGRASYAADGALVAWHGRKWETVQQIVTAAELAGGVNLCQSETCACRQLLAARKVA